MTQIDTSHTAIAPRPHYERPKEAVPTYTIPFRNDSIQSMVHDKIQEVANEPKKAGILDFFTWIWESITGSGSKADSQTDPAQDADGTIAEPAAKTPEISPQDEIDVQNMPRAIEEMSHLNHRIKDITEENIDNLAEQIRRAEPRLYMLLVQCRKVQRELYEASQLNDYERMNDLLEENKKIREEYFDTLKTVAERAKTSKTLGTACNILTIVVLATVALGLIATGVGAIAAAAGAAAGIGAAVSKGAQAGIDYDKDQKEKKVFSLNFERNENNTTIAAIKEATDHALDCVGDSWEQLSKIAESQYRAGKVW